jgi:hypothetical protein
VSWWKVTGKYCRKGPKRVFVGGVVSIIRMSDFTTHDDRADVNDYCTYSRNSFGRRAHRHPFGHSMARQSALTLETCYPSCVFGKHPDARPIYRLLHSLVRPRTQPKAWHCSNHHHDSFPNRGEPFYHYQIRIAYYVVQMAVSLIVCNFLVTTTLLYKAWRKRFGRRRLEGQSTEAEDSSESDVDESSSRPDDTEHSTPSATEPESTQPRTIITFTDVMTDSELYQEMPTSTKPQSGGSKSG